METSARERASRVPCAKHFDEGVSVIHGSYFTVRVDVHAEVPALIRWDVLFRRAEHVRVEPRGHVTVTV